MTFPNDPGRGERRTLSAKVGYKGWAFGAIIVIAVIVVISAFIWIENSKPVSNTSTVPPAATNGGGASQSTGSGAPAAPGKR